MIGADICLEEGFFHAEGEESRSKLAAMKTHAAIQVDILRCDLALDRPRKGHTCHSYYQSSVCFDPRDCYLMSPLSSDYSHIKPHVGLDCNCDKGLFQEPSC